jgi:RNA-directed DNA polymerase
MNYTSNMNVGRESDDRVVPAKCSNKDGGTSSAESAEGRRSTKENSGQTTASQTQSWGNALSGLRRVREAAKKDKRLQLTALLHHVSGPLLLDSFYALKREAAPGVDGMTWKEYETDLDKRLEDLHSRVHRGAYRALPSKRAYIPKRDGRQRPLGIAALEDKIVQHAVGTVLNQIYEEDFLGFSYGFRPGRSQHDALDALWVGIMRKKVNWVLDADVRDFFRIDFARMDGQVPPAPHRRSTDSSADPEVAESRSVRGWRMLEDGNRDASGLGDHASYTKGNFQFERKVVGWRERYTLLDLRRK